MRVQVCLMLMEYLTDKNNFINKRIPHDPQTPRFYN